MAVGAVPEWTRGDRMRKALEHAGVGVTGMADYMGVTRQAVGNWIAGRVKPSKQTMRLWAMRTGVPLVWLETGAAPVVGPGPEGYTARDLNPEPADLESARRRFRPGPGRAA